MERPLFWHQGLFLQPQHFQLSDLHAESLLEPFHAYLTPHFWGIGSLKIQETALDNFIFDIPKGSFLFQDRTFAVLAANALIQPRSFEHAWEDGRKKLKVYVGLKKWNNEKENVTILENSGDLSGITTRFIADPNPKEIRDQLHTGPDAEIEQMDYLLNIFWEDELPQLGDYLLIPVAVLERSGEEILLSPHFIPPALTLAASPSLTGIVKEIRDLISSRSRQLEASKQTKGVHTAEFGSRDMVYMLALRSLNRYGPLLAHLTAPGLVHPWTLYGYLTQVVGELSTFSEKISAQGETQDGTSEFPSYDHTRLWDCFSKALLLITRLLDAITSGPEYILPLIFDGTYFTTELNPQIFDGRNRFYLVMESLENEAFITMSMQTIAKLGTRESLPILIAQSLPGVRLEPLGEIPQELPRKGDAVYFQIDHHGDHWAQVQLKNNLTLYWDTAPADLTIELMIVRRNG